MILAQRLEAVLKLRLASLAITGPSGLEIRRVDAGFLGVQFDQVLLTTPSAAEAPACFVGMLLGDVDDPETDALVSPKLGLRRILWRNSSGLPTPYPQSQQAIKRQQTKVTFEALLGMPRALETSARGPRKGRNGCL